MNSPPIYTYNVDGDLEALTDLDMQILTKISNACANGCVCELKTLLNSLQSDKLSPYLNTMIECYGDKSRCFLTALMIASLRGQDSVVRFLLENYSQHCIVDAQSYSCCYDVEYERYKGPYSNKQTALWLAVESEHLNVVQTLISLGKPNVNHKAYGAFRRHITPLGLACIKGQLEMVKYLVENGANLYDVNEDESTSLMIASACGHYDIVQYLLSVADNSDHLCNAINKKGSTALHAVTSGYKFVNKLYDEDNEREFGTVSRQVVDKKLDIFKLLLEQHHAKIIKDKDDYTSLTIASAELRQELIEYYLRNENQSWYTISQLINEFELFGSKYISSPEKSYPYLMQAMKLRYRDPNAPILKTNLPSPIKAYEYCQECQTIEELESIRDDPDRISIECLMIQERRVHTSIFLHLLERHANSTYRSYEEHQRALQLYLHMYHLKITTQSRFDKRLYILENCISIMNQMIYQKKTEQIPFDTFLTILDASENEFLENRALSLTLEVKKKEDKKCPCSSCNVHIFKNYDADEYLYIIRNLLIIGTEMLKCGNETEQKQRQRHILRRIRHLNSSDYRTLRDNKTLLHLSLMDERNYPHVINISCAPKFPSLAAVKLLLSCGAEINAIDIRHKTPLHQIAENKFRKYIMGGWDFFGKGPSDLKIIFETLVDAGAHLDAISEGKTPADCAQHAVIQTLFRAHPIQLSLKCICARMIRDRKLNFTNRIPAHLHSFVQLH